MKDDMNETEASFTQIGLQSVATQTFSENMQRNIIAYSGLDQRIGTREIGLISPKIFDEILEHHRLRIRPNQIFHVLSFLKF